MCGRFSNVKTVHVIGYTCAEIHGKRPCETCDAGETRAFHVKHAQTPARAVNVKILIAVLFTTRKLL